MPAGAPATLIERLCDPDFHGLPAGAPVDHRQTHISHVFLAGDRALKIKKPVDFGFLDFTTLARREQACREELRLNRRLAPDVYRAVEPIVQRTDGTLALGGEGEPVEWAVVMRRLPDSGHLAARVAAGEPVEPAVHRVAARLVRFYRQARTGQAPGPNNRVSVVTANWDENLAQTADMVGDVLTAVEFSTVAAATSRFLGVHGRLFDARAAAGFVGDHHGDLRGEHVYLDGDTVRILDCIEFNERFRYCDAANDLACLGMDLDRLGAPGAARALVTAYATARPDPGAYALWDFFKCYRAYVQGKVAGFTVRDSAIDAAQRDRAREVARTAFALACRYAARFVRPPCICLSGPMGCGKSTVARALATHADLAVVSTDVVRKTLAGLAPTARVGEADAEGLYHPAMSRRTYLAVLDRGREHLETGRGVVLDGTFGLREGRVAARKMAEGAGAPFLLVRCDLDEARNRQRLQDRLADDTRISDARPDLLAEHLRRFEWVADDEAARVVHCDLAAAVETVEHAALQGVFLD